MPLHPGFAASWERLRTESAALPFAVNRAEREHRFQLARRGSGVLGGGDGAHHHDSAGARREHLGQPVERRCRRSRTTAVSVSSAAAVRTRSSPGAVRPGLVGVGQHGPTQK